MTDIPSGPDEPTPEPSGDGIRVFTAHNYDGEVYINARDLLAWLDRSIFDYQQGPVSTAVKMELIGKIGEMAGLAPPA